MQGKPAHFKLRGSVPEPAQPQVECLLYSRELLFPSPDEHKGSSSSEDELSATKGKKNVTWYFQLRAVYRAWKADHGHVKSLVSPLTPVSQHHSANENRCLCGIAQAPGQHHSCRVANSLYFSLANSLVLMHMLACAHIYSRTCPEMGTNLGLMWAVILGIQEVCSALSHSVCAAWGSCSFCWYFTINCVICTVPQESSYSLILCELLSKYIFCPGESAAHHPLREAIWDGHCFCDACFYFPPVVQLQAGHTASSISDTHTPFSLDFLLKAPFSLCAGPQPQEMTAEFHLASGCGDSSASKHSGAAQAAWTSSWKRRWIFPSPQKTLFAACHRILSPELPCQHVWELLLWGDHRMGEAACVIPVWANPQWKVLGAGITISRMLISRKLFPKYFHF